ncbi:hypothetical protein KFL_001440210 [Klebsormidium nitens]|uniref:C2HC/C3H-type domain-containing protein n=1 Tax=Klebsormidium nitens TaxID=105231 RepID=A0A1Y1HYR7_KLENI|nr:hypothetical protein KFL_001440210 [Klebsormidium nitens]|eukprot:GAQ83333.1 hypothetical protein KFL_001440210 [Klebsormidium nitens]
MDRCWRHLSICSKLEKWLNEENKKPKKERRPLPQPPKELPILNGPASPKEIDAFNEAMYEHWEKEVLESCAYCGRRFKPEALKIHNRSCTAEKPAKPAGTALTAASLSNNLSPGAISGTKHVAPGAREASPEESTSPKIGGAKGGRVGAEGLRASANGGMKVAGKVDGALRASSEGLGTKQKAVGGSSGRDDNLNMAAVGRNLPAAEQKSELIELAGEGTKKNGTTSNGNASKFCDECGAAFPKETSKFCGECGSKRPAL